MNAIIALNPAQMAEAQTTTVTWAEKKLADANSEFDEAQKVFDSLNAARLNVKPATVLLDKAGRRVRFYEKVKAALEAGYYIIPPFDLQLFAIRTNLAAPTADSGDSRWTREQAPRRLGIGSGEWKNPTPVREVVDRVTEPTLHDPSKTREVAIFKNTEWRDLELPVRAMKPTIIEAVGKALEEKIFDALGIAPAYRAADPIIAGRILYPDGKGRALTFFVAWWLDEADL